MTSRKKKNRKQRRAIEAALRNAQAAREAEKQQEPDPGERPEETPAAVPDAEVQTAQQEPGGIGRLKRYLFHRSLTEILVYVLILTAVVFAVFAFRRESVRRSEMKEMLEELKPEPIPEEEIAALEAAEQAARDAEQAAREAELTSQKAAEQAAREAAEKAAAEEAARLAEEERIRNLPQRIVFIGDSRTVQLEKAVEYDKSFCYFSAEVSMGYDWMRSTGVPQADGLIGNRTAVVINMGVNDLANAERYAEYVNELYASWSRRGARVWYMSVNPVGDHASVTNEQISQFNSVLREKLNSGIGWIDTNSMLMKEGFTAGDSLHYDNKTYQKIYDHVMRTLGVTA